MVILTVLLMNALVSLIFFAVKFIKKETRSSAFLFLMFLFFPVGGFIIYAMSVAVFRKSRDHSYESDFRIDKMHMEQAPLKPIIEKELNIIPVEDAMAVCSNNEKRKLLLEQLKKDIYTNYKGLMAASSDTDSESAHYVASAKMEVYRYNRAKVNESLEKYNKNQENLSYVYELMDHIVDFIESELLSEGECNTYKRKYCDIFESALVTKERFDIFYYEKYLSYLVDLKQYEKAAAWWKNLSETYKNEKSYIDVLNMYYKCREKEKFYQTLEDLCASDLILSAEGLKLVNFWKMREHKCCQ